MTAVWGAVENVMDSMGLMSGTLAPAKRAVVGAGLGYMAVMAVRPSSMFYDDGQPRPWSYSQTGSDYDGSGTGAHSTAVPYWSVPLAGAFLLGACV
jgi:hypothetical protein